MYYVTPSTEHRESVYAFLDKCLAAGDDERTQFGGWGFNQAVRENCYEHWMEEAARASHDWGTAMRHSLLLVETLEGLSSMEPEYVNQFPHIKDDLYLIGMVNIQMAGKTEEGEKQRKDVGIVEFCLLPTCRDVVSYQLAISRLQLYVVCAGLFYKYLQVNARQVVMPGKYHLTADSSPCKELRYCFFELEFTDPSRMQYICDMRLAHNLRAGIAHYKRREG